MRTALNNRDQLQMCVIKLSFIFATNLCILLEISWFVLFFFSCSRSFTSKCEQIRITLFFIKWKLRERVQENKNAGQINKYSDCNGICSLKTLSAGNYNTTKITNIFLSCAIFLPSSVQFFFPDTHCCYVRMYFRMWMCGAFFIISISISNENSRTARIYRDIFLFAFCTRKKNLLGRVVFFRISLSKW